MLPNPLTHFYPKLYPNKPKFNGVYSRKQRMRRT